MVSAKQIRVIVALVIVALLFAIVYFAGQSNDVVESNGGQPIPTSEVQSEAEVEKPAEEPAEVELEETPEVVAEVLAEQPAEEPAEVLAAVEQPAEQPAEVLAAVQVSKCRAYDPFSGLDGFKPIRQGLPAYIDFRDHVLIPGDMSEGMIYFVRDYPSITLDRVVFDDVGLSATYISAGGVETDLLGMLGMTWVTPETIPSMDSDLLITMASRGVNVIPNEGEILMQNTYSIHLGRVAAGSCIVFSQEDDPKLNVNNGGFFAVVSDVTAFSQDLNGNVVPSENWTFFHEQLTHLYE